MTEKIFCKNCKYHEDNTFFGYEDIYRKDCQHPKLFTIAYNPERGGFKMRDYDYINTIRRPFPEFETTLYQEFNRNFDCFMYEPHWKYKLMKFLRLA
jgi:hypothetical protein